MGKIWLCTKWWCFKLRVVLPTDLKPPSRALDKVLKREIVYDSQTLPIPRVPVSEISTDALHIGNCLRSKKQVKHGLVECSSISSFCATLALFVCKMFLLSDVGEIQHFVEQKSSSVLRWEGTRLHQKSFSRHWHVRKKRNEKHIQVAWALAPRNLLRKRDQLLSRPRNHENPWESFNLPQFLAIAFRMHALPGQRQVDGHLLPWKKGTDHTSSMSLGIMSRMQCFQGSGTLTSKSGQVFRQTLFPLTPL